jgi:hypothetical protein
VTDSGGAARHGIQATVVALFLVAVIDLLTNSIDTDRFSWDFRYYAAMAEHGLNGPLASPFAYRYLIPLLVRGLSLATGLSIGAGFTLIAYLGAFSQLLGVFLFTRWYTRSVRGAWLAMFVVAFSLFNVKFLIFDPFRPDHLAYPLILLQAYFALSGRFVPLVVATMIGSQIREFNVVPLVAYLYASVRGAGAPSTPAERRRTIMELAISIGALGAALVLPRVLIPIVEDFQFASFSRDGVLRPLLAPFILARDANFIYSIAAYMLPVLALAGPREILQRAGSIARRDRIFFGTYVVLVVALSFLGGVDFFRFSTYLLLPQIVLLGLLTEKAPAARLGIMLASVFAFNRVWLPFPMSDQGAYLDFYGGFGTRFNDASVWRIAELIVLIGIGMLSRRFLKTDRSLQAIRSP